MVRRDFDGLRARFLGSPFGDAALDTPFDTPLDAILVSLLGRPPCPSVGVLWWAEFRHPA